MALIEPSGPWEGLGARVHETICFFLLCAGLLLLLSAWVKSLLTCRALPRALAFLRCMSRRLAASCQEGGEEEVDLLVRKRILELKVSHFSFFLSILAGLNGLIGSFVLWGIVNRATVHISPFMLLVFAVTQVYLSVLAWLPRGVSVRTMDLHYFCNMMSCALTVAPPARPTILLILTQTAVVVAMNCARGTMRSHWRLPLFGACNLFFAICASLSVLSSDETAFFAPFWFAIELLGLPLLAFALPVLEGQLHSALRQGLQLEECKELYNAACALLDGCCEVVVELDSEHRFSSPEPAFGSWLMLGGASLQGRRLDDFVAGDEAKTELEKRFGKKRGPGAEIMQLSFRDGWNNFVRAELLWFNVRRLDGAQRCILGIRDLSRGPQDDFPVGARAGMSGEAVAVVNCEQPGYPVVSLSPGFLSTVGRLPLGEPLLHSVSKPQKVLLWVQEAMNLAHHDDEEGVPEDCQVTFKMPQGKVHTVCNLLAPMGQLDVGRIHLHFAKRLNETSSSSSSEGQLLGTPRSSPSQSIRHTTSL